MDQEQELKRAKWILGAGAIFLISAFMSFDEFRYKIWGRMSDARVIQVRPYEELGRRGRSTPRLSVEYSFQDEAKNTLTARDNVSLDTHLPEDGRLPVQFIPGSADSSRIAGQSNSFGIIVFFASLTVLALFIIKLAREANAPPSRGPKRRPI